MENYKKLNIEIGKAFMLTNDVKTKKILLNLVELAHEVFPKNLSKEEYDTIEESFYTLYNNLLLNNNIMEESRSNILACIDILLMNKRPNEIQKTLVR